jgi:hypothetical protein
LALSIDVYNTSREKFDLYVDFPLNEDIAMRCLYRFIAAISVTVLGIWATVISSCGTPDLRINLYLTTDQHEQKPERLVFLAKNDFSSADLWVRESQPPHQMRLTDLPCPTDGANIPPVFLDVEYTGSLLPYLEVQFYKKSETSPAFVGRFPLALACHELQAAIFLTPPNAISRWQANEPVTEQTPKQALDRIGHQVTAMPDGRYLISGGVKRLSMNGLRGLPNLSGWIVDTVIYDLVSGKLESGPTIQARAFHSAHWSEDQLLLFGGMTPNSTQEQLTEIADTGELWQRDQKSGKWIFKGNPPIPANQRCAFHHSLTLPKPKAADQYASVIIGGMRKPQPDQPSDDSEHDVLFSSLTYIEPNILVMLGGAYGDQDGGFKVSPIGIVFEIQEDGAVKELRRTNMLSEARAGHTASYIKESNTIVVVGGFYTTGTGELKIKDNAEFISLNSEYQRLSSKPQLIIAKQNDDVINLSRRAFHVAKVSPESPQQILIAGGIFQASKLGETQHSELPAFLLKYYENENKSESGWAISTLSDPNPRGLLSATTLSTGQILLIGGAKRDSEAMENFHFVAVPDSFTWYQPSPQLIPVDKSTSSKSPDKSTP